MKLLQHLFSENYNNKLKKKKQKGPFDFLF